MAPIISSELVDDAGRLSTTAEAEALLHRIVKDYGLRHLSYVGINLPGAAAQGNVTLRTTYTPAWLARYATERYLRIDPVVREGLQHFEPFDWRACRREPPGIARFFGESIEFGVGSQGLTVPLRGIHGEGCLFSVNAEYRDREWQQFLRTYRRDFIELAVAFHACVLRLGKIAQAPVTLTTAELQALRWAAAGKTDWETAEILGIKMSTVRDRLTRAYGKLGAVSKAQAVAKARSLFLFCPE
jgi:DNA-binding CsgD family transcriptional regulator